MEPDICRYCCKRIPNRDQLVTAFKWGKVQPFHYLCFQEIQKETIVFRQAWKPLNGWEGNTAALLLAVLAVLFLGTNTGGRAGTITGMIVLYPLFLRCISYFLFERKIEK